MIIYKCLETARGGGCWLARTSCNWKVASWVQNTISTLVKCHILGFAHSSRATRLTCVASSAVVWVFVISGLTLMNVGLFTLVFIIFLLDSVKCFALSHLTHACKHTRTHAQHLRGWKEKDKKKMGDRGGRINAGRTCCPGARVAVQSTHPSCFLTPWQTCFNNAIYWLFTMLHPVSSSSQISLIQEQDIPTTYSKNIQPQVICCKMWCGESELGGSDYTARKFKQMKWYHRTSHSYYISTAWHLPIYMMWKKKPTSFAV